ncbi:MAG: S9 family peptidase, partial [Roseiflexaceae bacterium]
MTERTPITIDDLYRLDWLEDPRMSPDGRQVAFVRVSVDRDGNSYRHAIWLASTDGGPARRFTAGAKSDMMPRWRPDGRRLVFCSNRSGDATQIYTIDLAGGEARQLTSLPYGASAPAWSPDGRQIAFLGRASADERAAEDSDAPTPEPTDDWDREHADARRKHAEQQRFDPRVLTRLPYRGGTSFFDDRRNHIYVIELTDDDEDTPPTPRRLTDGDWHYSAPVWMPDGQSILTTATRDPEADSIFAYYDLLRVPVPATGRAEAVRLTEAGFSYYDPEPSPDGRLIALRRLPDDRPLAAGARIAVLSADGPLRQAQDRALAGSGDTDTPRDLTAETDLSVEQHRWLPDGGGLLYTAEWRGAEAVYRVMLDDEEARIQGDKEINSLPVSLSPCRVSPVFPANGRIISEFDIGPDGSVAFVAGAPDNPCDLFLRRPDGQEIQLTRINDTLLA